MTNATTTRTTCTYCDATMTETEAYECPTCVAMRDASDEADATRDEAEGEVEAAEEEIKRLNEELAEALAELKARKIAARKATAKAEKLETAFEDRCGLYS